MQNKLKTLAVILLCICAFGCMPLEYPSLHDDNSLSEATEKNVYVLRGKPTSNTQFKELDRTRRCLIMIPGISSGDLKSQAKFLNQVKLKNRADMAVFQHWGHNDPTRIMASPLATANAANDLAVLCKRIFESEPGETTIDILAHSAGTIIVNKAAILLKQNNSQVVFRHVLLLGTPHDTDVDLYALKKMSRSVLNIYSGFDKINRNVSNNAGFINDLDKKPYWNMRMDTSIGGRRIRHYAFIESTPENWLQYGNYLRTGNWPSPKPLTSEIEMTPENLYGVSLWIKSAKHVPPENAGISPLIHKSLNHSNPEIRYYGALLAGLTNNPYYRAILKKANEQKRTPDYVRREICQALGSIGDPSDMHYLQKMRKADTTSGDVLRDILRDWKRKRIGDEH